MEQNDVQSATASVPPPPLPPPAAGMPAGGGPPVTNAPSARRTGGGLWRWLLGCGCLLVLCWALLAAAIGALFKTGAAHKPFGQKVAVVYVSGAISSGASDSGPFSSGGAASERVIHDLRTAVKESGVKAIVLRVNSPGGSAAASQEIYQEIVRVRGKGMPVVVSMADVAASGGYYVSAPADMIFADNGTLTGSIGVILQTTDMTALFSKIGLKPETIKSGKHKDMFSPSRSLTDEERIMAKAMILDIYDQFVSDVLEGRKHKGLTREKLLAVADGRVLTGRQARDALLVDEIGSLQDAIQDAARRGGIKGEPSVWKVKRSFWETLAEAKMDVRPNVILDLSRARSGGAALDEILMQGR
jgi:protease-4